MNRRALLAGLFAAAVVGIAPDAEARRRSGRRGRRRRARGLSGGAGGSRGTTDGECPCNGGKVCVGPRGGRYCITSGGNKRYGV
jgi:hypothetical protein